MMQTAGRKFLYGDAALAKIPSPRLEIRRVPCLKDNYGWILRCPETGTIGLVDTPEAGPLLRELKANYDGRVDFILNTHHHWDHTGGNKEIKAATHCRVIGPGRDGQIDGLDKTVEGGDEFKFGDLTVKVYDLPGHTRGHVGYHFPEANAFFCGDTLFVLGCGRMFEGTKGQFWSTLQKIRSLPKETVMFCAHEYSQSNAKFARYVDPANECLKTASDVITDMRSRGEATVPSMLADELLCNPFLRVNDEAVQKRAAELTKTQAHDLSDVFAQVRLLKDSF
ncbi:Hydroxyacylglutathione hydrolase [Perkinsus olseni]|uniref:hydroxyacylglutathione hydrolase n=1 Tax=Perkinsus olseni TaxID=32597 RepID=A0A7J6NAX1_PEROL|nr:Hydroxyacylglutathione hydrolase [Perkinsus olseni]